MMMQKQFAALIGFAFVFAWIFLGFGEAVLCLVGAAVFYAVAAFLQGELDLFELQDRLSGGRGSRSGGGSPSTGGR